MKKIFSVTGRMLILIGICGLLSPVVQYIIFPETPPYIISLVFGIFFLVSGYIIFLLSKKVK